VKIVFQDLDIGKENPSKIFCNQIKKIIFKYKMSQIKLLQNINKEKIAQI
jgi:hypothetical protein